MNRFAIGFATLAMFVFSFAPVALAQEANAGTDQDSIEMDEATEAVIKGSLSWMKTQQTANGSWTANKYKSDHRVAMTAYVLCAYMAAGNLPNEGEFGKTVNDGAYYLLSCIGPDGYIKSDDTKMYDHGIASIALSELYGQTRYPDMKKPVQRAIDLIVNCQNDKGGWRYDPRIMDDDISVTVLQVVALRAAKNAGLNVPERTIQKAYGYIMSNYRQQEGAFSYQPGGPPGFARTAAGIYSLQVLGHYQEPAIGTGVKYIWQHHDPVKDEFFTYGNFYAAPAFYMVGGEDWKNWYTEIHNLLMDKKIFDPATNQVHWNPLDERGVAPIYATAVYTTVLAMPYHYVPLYQR